MIVRCRIELTPDRVIACRPEWGYHLYAALLERGPQGYAQKIHQDGPSPVSQYLCARDGRILWTVTLLGEEAREALNLAEGSLSMLWTHIRANNDGRALEFAGRIREHALDLAVEAIQAAAMAQKFIDSADKKHSKNA